MHHIFAIEDLATLNSIVWTELRKHGIKEAGRARKPTRNNVHRFFTNRAFLCIPYSSK
jgi:hypothetical protein